MVVDVSILLDRTVKQVKIDENLIHLFDGDIEKAASATIRRMKKFKKYNILSVKIENQEKSC